MKKENQNAILKFSGLVLLFVVLIIIGRNTSNKHAEYYKEVNLYLIGEIAEIRPLTNYGHDFGVIAIDINKTNIDYYDEREKLEKHLGVIKNKKADLVFSGISRMKKGDSIVLNVQNYKLYRNGKLITENVVDLPRNNFIFTPFKEVNRKIKL